MKYPHTPGSDQAVKDGCSCPVLDNARGRGCGYMSQDGEPCFIYNAACPLHGCAVAFPEDTIFARDTSGPAYGAAARMKEKIA